MRNKRRRALECYIHSTADAQYAERDAIIFMRFRSPYFVRPLIWGLWSRLWFFGLLDCSESFIAVSQRCLTVSIQLYCECYRSLRFSELSSREPAIVAHNAVVDACAIL